MCTCECSRVINGAHDPHPQRAIVPRRQPHIIFYTYFILMCVDGIPRGGGTKSRGPWCSPLWNRDFRIGCRRIEKIYGDVGRDDIFESMVVRNVRFRLCIILKIAFVRSKICYKVRRKAIVYKKCIIAYTQNRDYRKNI